MHLILKQYLTQTKPTISPDENGTTANGAGNGLHRDSTKDHHTGLALKIIIVGAGIGGLALASVLGHNGHKITVLEAAPEIGEVSKSHVPNAPGIAEMKIRSELGSLQCRTLRAFSLDGALIRIFENTPIR
jgi:NADPH-dependent glutamate synthase beta subunit-like oxidoreductase